MNSIVRSNSVDGKVDVWSAEGVGTEIKITFTAEAVEDDEISGRDAELVKVYDSLQRPAISLVGFEDRHRGVQLLRNVLSTYLVARWGFSISSGNGDISIVNEDCDHVVRAMAEKGPKRPFIILSSSRGDPKLMAVVGDYERIGGFCRIVYKPVGPQRLYSVLKLCLHALNIAEVSRNKVADDMEENQRIAHLHESPSDPGGSLYLTGMLSRRYSEETGHNKKMPQLRPSMGPRAITVHPLSSWSDLASTSEQEESPDRETRPESPLFSQNPSSPTISIGTGGSLLKSSVGTLRPKGPIRVLVVEDNAILRSLL